MAGGGNRVATIKEKYDGFAAACKTAGRSVKQFDVCKMTFMAVAPNAAGVNAMIDELATTNNLTPDALTSRVLVATPDGIIAHLRALTEIGVNHHIFNVAPSQQWPDYWDSIDLLAREVVPKVRA
jgi:alkanesulfonate monooxygenase SsuD/methylene tetrahydromethanopterin reductase-like flavin-dependent oxidoreductase (luciferase family)